MTKHEHYNSIRAFADGWGIELRDSDGDWRITKSPSFVDAYNYRVIPDADGWLPWYGEDCPVDPFAKVDVVCGGECLTNMTACNVPWNSVIRYRHSKQGKKVKMWLWVIEYEKGSPVLSACYLATPHFNKDVTVLGKAEWSMIEVEE